MKMKNEGAKWLAGHINRLDHLLQLIYSSLMRYHVYTLLVGLLLLTFLFLDTSFHVILRKDSFFYMLKGMEITNGDFSLFRPHAVGWPVFLSFGYFLLGTDNIFDAMVVARGLSVLLVCFSLVPLVILCRRTCKGEARNGAVVVVITLFSFSHLIQNIATVAYTEPLFLFLSLWCYCFLAKSEKLTSSDILFAAIFAGLSYWVRANGLFHLFIILGVIAVWSPKEPLTIIKNGSIAVLSFLLVAAPQLIMRYQQFGSPFDYGPNSKYFVDSYKQVWDDTIPVPSFFEYLQTHSWADYYDKFIEDGLLNVLQMIPDLLDGGWPMTVLLVLAFLAAIIWKKREIYPLILLFLLTVAGMSLVFEIFGVIRHLIFLVPFYLIGIVALLSQASWQNLRIANILCTLLLIYGLTSLDHLRMPENEPFRRPQVHDKWALWAADNLEGKVAVVSGGDLLRMAQHYKYPASNRIPEEYDKVNEKITRIRPGNYNSLQEAYSYFQADNIRYVITDQRTMTKLKRRTYLRSINDEKWRDTFVPIKHFPGNEPGAVFYGVTIYKVL